MNQYIKNLRRIEFVITWACTGRCKHCSEGDHTNIGVYIDGNAAARVIHELGGEFDIDSVMTFGGEPLLHIDEVCMIHKAANEMNIPRRQIITNGYFSKDSDTIKQAVVRLTESGVNDILLSVDAFHQETIPLEPVKTFAMEVKRAGILLRTQPAWLVSKEDDNPYNRQTAHILQEFGLMGIEVSDGNIIFPEGNALKYLGSYFDLNEEHVSPYTENPEDVRSICISPDGGVLSDNIYRSGILDIIENYVPDRS